MRAKFFSFFILILAIFIGSYKMSNAFFASSATSQNNTFATAEQFPTLTPTPGGEEVIPSPTPTNSPTPTPIVGLANHLVISEVQITEGASTLGDHDFVEIYNPTSSPVNLQSWRLRVKNSAGTESSLVLIGAGKTIPAHGYFLWASSDDSFNVTVSADESTGSNLASSNSVALESSDSGNPIIDQVAWGTGTSQFVEGVAFASNPGANQSIERKAYSTSDATSMTGVDATKGNGYDTDDNSNDFIIRTTSQPQNSLSSIEIP